MGLQDGKRAFIALVEDERNHRDDNDDGWVTFDSVAESFFDTVQNSGTVHPKQFNSKDGLLLLRARIDELPGGQNWVDLVAGTWVQITVHAEIGDLPQAEVVLFGPVDGEPPVVGLEIVGEAPATATRVLDHFSMLSREREAPHRFISGILDLALSDENLNNIAVAAYDVGQGNCNAIVNSYEHAKIFFDLGWAPNFHAKSRPKWMPDFFSCDDELSAPVVLSHWDMDHWCYAIEGSQFNPSSLTTTHKFKARALQRFWIARAPLKKKHKIGPLTLAFYFELKRTCIFPGQSAILLWPRHMSVIRFSAGWLEACRPSTPVHDDRNNNGIAMFVTPSIPRAAILLTGDAHFESIPGVQRKVPLAGLVAPHHGSYVSPGHVPTPARGSPRRLIMSVGGAQLVRAS